MLVADIESDGLLDTITKLHCINVYDTEVKKQYRFNDTFPSADGSLEEGLKLLEEADVYGGHNFIDYDLPAIKKLYPNFNPKGSIRDSLVECRVIYPNIEDLDFRALRKKALPPEFQSKGLVGLHKLEAWGWRLGEYKSQIETDWSEFTQEMDDYCMQDVMVNVRLFKLLDSKNYPKECLDLEHAVASIIQRQESHGFLFNKPKAIKLQAELEARRAVLEYECKSVFKPWYKPDGKFLTLDEFKIAGRGLKVAKIGKPDSKAKTVKGCPYTKLKLTTFNPNSRLHISDRLITLFGWKPTETTPSGQPKVDDEILASLNYPRVNEIAKFMLVQKRLGQLSEGKKSWLNFIKEDGRIHGRVNTNGALTGRMTHSFPNLAQVPSCKSEYGAECRDLFTVPKGYKLVGCDASGLELRGMANRMYPFDKGAYADIVLNGDKAKGTDEHSINQKALKLNSRDNAKTWYYAFLYGASDGLLGKIVVEDFDEDLRQRFFNEYPAGARREAALRMIGAKSRTNISEGLPALAKMIESIQKKAKKNGHLIGLDGRTLPVRHQHAVLNLQLQSDGAIIMKKALVMLDEILQAGDLVPGVDYEFVANVHDEFQIEVKDEHADTVGKLAAQAIHQAGVYYKFKCELAGEYDVGMSWKETH